MLQSGTHKNIQEYKNARSHASKILRQNKRVAEKKLIEDITKYSKKEPRLFFEKCKSVSQGYKARASIIKDEHGNLIKDTKKISLHFM